MELPFAESNEGPLVLDTLKQRWQLILFVAVLGGALGFVVSQLRAESFEATAEIIVRVPGSDTLFGTLTDAAIDPERYVNDQAAILASRQVSIGALAILDDSMPEHGYALNDIVNNTEIRVSADSDVIEIRFRANEKEAAVNTVNALVATFGEVSDARSTSYPDALTQLELSIAAATDAIEELQTEIDDITAGGLSSPARQGDLDLLLDRRSHAVSRESALLARRDQLAVDAALEGSSIGLISAAVAAQTIGTSWLLGLIAGLVLGGTVGATLAYWFAPFRLRTSEKTQPELILRAPLLGEIPSIGRRLPVVSERTSLVSERLWSVSRLLLPAERPGGAEPGEVPSRERIIAFVSADPDESRSLVAANVAAAASQAGGPVLLVSTQYQGRGLVQLLGQDGIELNDDGLMFAMEDPPRAARSVQTSPIVGAPLLDVLVCRNGTRSPRDLFASARFGEVLDTLVDGYSLVILDVPPVLHEAYAVDVLRQAGQTIAVVANRSTMRSLKELRHHLDLHALSVDGYIYTTARSSISNRPVSTARTNARDRDPERARSSVSGS